MSKRRVGAGTFTFGFLLIVIGILFLVENFTDISVWDRVWKYWPLILIVFGLSKIIQSVTQGKETRAGEIILIIFIIIVGLIITNITTIEFPLHFRLWQDDYAYKAEKEIPCSPDSTIFVTNKYGDIDVVPWSEDKVKAILSKRVWAASEKVADRYEKEIELMLIDTMNRIEVKYEIKQKHHRDFDYSCDFKVLVPERSFIEVSCNDGNVYLEGVSGNHKIENRYGDVQVDNIEGDLILDARDGQVSIDKVSGNVEITSRYAEIDAKNIDNGLSINNQDGYIYVSSIKESLSIKNKHSTIEVYDIEADTEIEAYSCDIKVKNVNGNLNVENSYNTLEIEEITGDAVIKAPNTNIYAKRLEKDLIIETSYESVEVDDVGGKLEVRANDAQVVARDIDGSIDVKTSYKDVTVYSWKAPITIENKDGGITLYDCLELNGQIKLTTSGEDIIIELPEDCSFNIDAKAYYGTIDYQFYGPNLQLIEAEDDDEISFQGSFNQGSHRIDLRVENGNIEIRKLEELEGE